MKNNLTSKQVLVALEVLPEFAYGVATILSKVPANSLPRDNNLFELKQIIENTVGTYHEQKTGVKPENIRFKYTDKPFYDYINNKKIITDIEEIYSIIVSSFTTQLPLYKLVNIVEEDLIQAILIYYIVLFEDQSEFVFSDNETTHEIVESDKFKLLYETYATIGLLDIFIKPSQNDWLLAIEKKREIFTCY